MTAGGRVARGPRLLVAVLAVTALPAPVPATVLPGGGSSTSDCWVVLRTEGDAPAAKPNRLECTDGDPACDRDGDCHDGSCTFRVQACINQDLPGCQAPASLRDVQIKPPKLGIPKPTTLSGPMCGGDADVVVPLGGRRKTRAGKRVVVLKARPEGAKGKDAERDLLVCLPRPETESCPTTTTSRPATTTTVGGMTTTTTSIPGATTTTVPGATTTTVPGATTTTIPGATTTTTSSGGTTTTTVAGVCAPIVVGESISNTYRLDGVTGEKRCVTTSPANRFGSCANDGECDNDPPCNVAEVDCTGTCRNLPWVTADGQVMSFPTGVQTILTVTAEGSHPTCEHAICIPCGNPNGTCAGVPGCAVAGNPNGCIPRATEGCCDDPGFVVPVFFVNLLGGLCSRVDQIGCGTGVVNTSNPQTGDNDVDKQGDTSDPGADCAYGTGDDPAPRACTVVGEGNDYNGKIVRTQGDGVADANGIQFRFVTPELSTTWTDNQSNPGECAPGSTFEDGEVLVSQLIIKAEPTSAGASGSFVDLSGEGCKRAGNGFISAANPGTDGPVVLPGGAAGPLRPQSYDGSVGAVMGAVSEVFSGPNSPIRDIGFVALTPNQPAVVIPTRSCSCNLANGCPE